MDHRAIGILGGGQLGRMLVEAANRLNIRIVILDGPDSPAKQICSGPHVDGSFTNAEDVRKLAKKCSILTIEIEHVDTAVLKSLEKDGHIIHPSPSTIELIQDKYIQKNHYEKRGISTPTFIPVTSTVHGLREAADTLSLPFMLKSRTNAYDGRGNFAVNSLDDIPNALSALGKLPLYAEKWAAFEKELAVMIVRKQDGSVLSYPVVETIHKSNICDEVIAPAPVDQKILERASELAKCAVQSLSGAGVYGVEMFLLENGELSINEIAPRVHNSGHYTIEACVISQYEAHIRAILDLPLEQSHLEFSTSTTHAIMKNILGGNTPTAHLDYAKQFLNIAGATVHLYGKGDGRLGRKMGHVTVIGTSLSSCLQKLNSVTDMEKSHESIIEVKKGEVPLVGVIMGSDSDLPKMQSAIDILNQFHVPHEVRIVSAHRTPFSMFDYATNASSRGLRVIIAGAGGAAHLPGMTASMTSLPVIGVPVKGKLLDGIDSMYSILQMPRGIPVATVAINNSMNAGLLALRILGAFDENYREKLFTHMKGMEHDVLMKDAELTSLGPVAYSEKYNL